VPADQPNVAGPGGLSTTAPQGSSSSSSAIAPYTSASYSYAFTRTAGQITIRGYLITERLPEGSPVQCAVIGPQFQAEVSTPRAVGIVDGVLAAADHSEALSAVRPQVIGTSEGDPTVVAIAATGKGVAEVRATFAGGRADTMKPVDGWVALAAPTTVPPSTSALSPASLGTLTALDSAGRVLATQRLTFAVLPGPVAPVPQVQPPSTAAPGRVVPGAVAPATGSVGASGGSTASSGSGSGSAGSAGSGSAGSGSAGSGSAGSGSAGSGGAVSGSNIVVPCTFPSPRPAGDSGGPAR
jgi:hypothetical protein